MYCKKSDCFDCPYPDCINDYVQPTQPLTEKTKEYLRKKGKERRQAFRELGLCTSCGKRKPLPGHVRCGECNAYNRRKKKEYRLRDGKLTIEMLDGVTRCRKCGKAPPEIGYRLCKACLAKARKALDKAPTHSGKEFHSGFTEVHEAWWRARKTSTMKTAEQKARSE